ncbi:Folate transporter 1 [Fukomys damarensis]|uniref:Folate transporter 1 n=1 Tax=Fukomys damarensis TaxID=885580 RepID=A0A091DAG8_FUKDA|nr:Folate transporter 1 [Fukomys damarensis]
MELCIVSTIPSRDLNYTQHPAGDCQVTALTAALPHSTRLYQLQGLCAWTAATMPGGRAECGRVCSPDDLGRRWVHLHLYSSPGSTLKLSPQHRSTFTLWHSRPGGEVSEEQQEEDEPRAFLRVLRCGGFIYIGPGLVSGLACERPQSHKALPLGLRRGVTNEITPVLSYSYLVVLVPIFLLTDYLRYKPVLLLQGLSYVCVWLLLLFGSSVPYMQLMEAFYSVTMAARIAYSSYIFSLVRPSRYQRMASYSRAAVLLGVFTSSVLGQLLVTVGRVRAGRTRAGKLGRVLRTCRDSFLVRVLYELGTSLRLPQLRLWSLWWIFNSAGYYLVVYYVHILWNVVYSTTNSARVYNGAADAASTLLGAIMSFAAGFLKIRWALWSKLVIAAVTATQAGLVFLLYNSETFVQHPHNIWLCYAAFVVFRGAYQFLVPIATFQIASSLSKELCALVFGINTFLATVLKTCITLVVSDKRGLGLPVFSQFRVYFVYFLVLSIIYFLGALLDAPLFLHHCRWRRHQPLPAVQELQSPSEKKAMKALSVQAGDLGGLQPSALPLPREDGADEGGVRALGAGTKA